MHLGYRALALVSIGSEILFSASVAQAEPGTSGQTEQQKKASDAAARARAASALGSSGSDAAVRPLCDALDDPDAKVKLAAVAALGKLGKPAGLTCLRAMERRASVSLKVAVRRSIVTLEIANRPAPPPPPGAGAKVYVALQIANKTARAAEDVDSMVRSAMQAKLVATPGYAVAPRLETTAQGRNIVRAKQLTGFLLLLSVEPPVYAGGSLTQVVRATLSTYPDRMLKAEFSPKLTQSSTTKGDTESENLLVRLCAENAVDTFLKLAASM